MLEILTFRSRRNFVLLQQVSRWLRGVLSLSARNLPRGFSLASSDFEPLPQSKEGGEMEIEIWLNSWTIIIP